MVQQHGWKINSTSEGKHVQHPKGDFWAKQMETLFFLPDAMVSDDEPNDEQQEDSQLCALTTDAMSKQYAKHQKDGHRPKMDGCPACEKA